MMVLDMLREERSNNMGLLPLHLVKACNTWSTLYKYHQQLYLPDTQLAVSEVYVSKK